MSHTKSLNVDYNYTVVRLFALTTVLWGIVGMGMGVFIAAQQNIVRFMSNIMEKFHLMILAEAMRFIT